MPADIFAVIKMAQQSKEFANHRRLENKPSNTIIPLPNPMSSKSKSRMKLNLGITDSTQNVGEYFLANYANFDDFLNSFVSKTDKEYIGDMAIARRLIELGFKGVENRGLNKRAFYKCKEMMLKKEKLKINKSVSRILHLEDNKMLYLLQQREEQNRTGKMSSIIMVRDYDPSGKYEISGYIDYAHRLLTEDFENIFNGTKKLLPQKGDLSFLIWKKWKVHRKNSPNYEVLVDNPCGMMFRNKRDNKIVFPHARTSELREASRTAVKVPDYLQVVFYDHINTKEY